jgi:two-component system, response regulator FlrC
VNLQLPPLRERPADIAPLAEYFAKKYAAANGLPERPLTPDALAMLYAHHWRGNVRELENTMHRAVLMEQGNTIEPNAIMLSGQGFAPDGHVQASPGKDGGGPATEGAGTLVGRTVADVERDLIIDTLQHCLGNRTHAATILGISIRTLRNKLKQYSEEGLPVPSAAGEGATF